MPKRRCKECRRLFEIVPQRPDQKYCGRKRCQQARKRGWQKEKLATDETYRMNQYEAQRRWLDDNPGYYKRWRERNPEYTRRNREKQRSRNLKNRGKANRPSTLQPIAKMDVSRAENTIQSGRYKLIPANDTSIANMDALIVELHLVSKGYDAIHAQLE